MKRMVERLVIANLVAGLAVGCSDADPPGEGTAEPQVQAPPAGVTPPPTSATGAGDAGPTTNPASSCSLDTRSFFVVDGRVVESITSGGRLFNFESNGAAWQNNGIDLIDVAGYASGPCRGRARGQCSLDTRTFVPVGNTLVESVTAYGSYWSFNEKGEATSTDLALMPRYKANGPCEGRAPGQCSFETRTFITEGGDVIESITAYGRAFNYKLDGTPLAGNGADLTTIARYAAGPCAGIDAGKCVFSTRVFEEVDGHVLETITAYGKVFRYEANGAAAFAEVQPSRVLLDGIEPWASGVCKMK